MSLASIGGRTPRGWWAVWVAALAVVLLAGCARAPQMGAMAAPMSPGGAVAPDAPTAQEELNLPVAGDKLAVRSTEFRTAQTGPAPTSTSTPPPQQPPTDPKAVAADVSPIQQMLIYTARLTMAVFEVDKGLAAVEALAKDSGGFLARRSDTSITIRVPSERFYEVMKKLDGTGDVLHKDVQVEDVTEQFLDVQLRLKNARQVRERIAQLLADSKTVKDSLEVEKELERLSTEIERLEGRIKYLRDRARYSTITVNFQPLRSEELRRDRVFKLPFPWLSELGLGRLMSLR